MCNTCNFFGLSSTLLSSTLSATNDTPSPGAPGLGDSLYPNFGNGGYDTQHYDVALNILDVESSDLIGLTTIEAIATQSLSRFNLDFIGFDIDQITVNGEVATFSRDGQELTITPATPIQNGDTFTVAVAYEGAPTPITSVAIPVPTGWVNFDGGSFVLSEPDGAANYYPVNDHPLDKASYTFRVTVPDPIEVAANGILEQIIPDAANARTTYVFEARDPMTSYLTTVNLSEFNLTTETSPGGVPIRNYFAEGIPENLLEPFDRQAEMVDFYSSIFGPYPFEVYGAVVMNTDTGTALETQTLSIFGIGQLGRASTEETIAHEVAHQWLGNSVALADWKDIWLNESFATYAQGLWVEYDQGSAALDAWVTDVYGFVADFFEFFVPPGEPPADDLFNPGVYDWGALGLHDLRLRVGEETFFDILQTYYDRHKGGNVSTSDLIAVAEDVSGQELDPFFDRWFYSENLQSIPALNLSFGNSSNIQQDLYFGRDIPGPDKVSQAEFDAFVADVIAPRFPEFTQFTATNQESKPNGGMGREKSNLIRVILEDTAENAIAIQEVIDAYQTQFSGTTVRQITNADDLDISTGAGEDLINNDADPEVIQVTLYLDRSKPGGGEISGQKFNRFISKEIAPYALSLTQFPTQGQTKAGASPHSTNAVSVLLEDTEANELAIQTILERYQTQFGGASAVAVANEDITVSFGPGDDLIDNTATPELIQAELYFGLNVPGQGEISAPEFQEFVDEVIAPRFSEFIRINARSLLNPESDSLIRENSKVLTLVIENTEANENALNEVLEIYQDQFQGANVLQVIDQTLIPTGFSTPNPPIGV